MQPFLSSADALDRFLQECLEEGNYRRALEFIEDWYLSAIASGNQSELGRIGACRSKVLSRLPTECLEIACGLAGKTNRFALLIQIHLLLASRYEDERAVVLAQKHYEGYASALRALSHSAFHNETAALEEDEKSIPRTGSVSHKRTYDQSDLSFL